MQITAQGVNDPATEVEIDMHPHLSVKMLPRDLESITHRGNVQKWPYRISCGCFVCRRSFCPRRRSQLQLQSVFSAFSTIKYCRRKSSICIDIASWSGGACPLVANCDLSVGIALCSSILWGVSWCACHVYLADTFYYKGVCLIDCMLNYPLPH